jgi:hypothetical protein
MKKLAIIALSTLVIAGSAQATTLSYNDFSSVAGLQINGNAAQSGNALRVTPATFSQGGSVFSSDAISLASNASFSTAFRFRFTNPGGACDAQGGCGADGLAFVVQTNANNVGGIGGGIGYDGIPNSMAVEFDTWDNGAIDNNSSNHLGIDLNGNMDSLVQAEVLEGDLNNGQIWTAWVDYNGLTDLLEVRLALGAGAARPGTAYLSYTTDLVGILGTTDAFVGFTSGTGAAYANHDVLAWEFNSDFNPINDIPEPESLMLVSLGFLALAAKRRKLA